MKISVLGYPWTVTVLLPHVFKDAYGLNCEGITIPETQEIVFRKDKISHLHIAHELTHAFKYYCSVEGIEFDGSEESDEFWCDFIGLHGETIIELTKKILKELK